ncbi:hypothetical protein [Piscirickettsia litoralis]|uniref:Signal transduction histidine kinase osmosensitive K+ channel sensor N-terminal domain-containing protein n=1 Tax=Piscirickettsia litoralis TaxID=1891921 RepID=A0ABX3ACE2_9GAMM|nr:hypothetical protein [Piscirickettsia litoralis]ODN43829.1 hypothetical protein BGC07_14165 [Piscirickettsia litoralis]
MPTPNPEALLKTIQADYSGRGKLKVFLGSAPGVGKTYAMLQAAHQALKKGIDVRSAIIETHGRHETYALTKKYPDYS